LEEAIMADENKKKQPNKMINLTDTLIIAAFPFLAYAVIFIYNYGYLNAFQLPLQFIAFNIGEVFIVMSGILGFAWVIFGITNLVMFFILNPNTPKPVARRINTLLPILIFSFAFFLLYTENWQRWLFLFIATIIMAAIMFLPALFTKRVKGTYLEKMTYLDENSTLSTSESSLIDEFANMIGRRAFVVLMYLILALYIVYHVGYAAAINQKFFRIVTTNPEKVVLYITNDKMIAAPFNRNTKKVEPRFVVLDIGADADLEIRLEQVGPLILNTTPIYPTPTPTVTPLPSVTPNPTSTSTPIKSSITPTP
jgi:hypothetical protein